MKVLYLLAAAATAVHGQQTSVRMLRNQYVATADVTMNFFATATEV